MSTQNETDSFMEQESKKPSTNDDADDDYTYTPRFDIWTIGGAVAVAVLMFIGISVVLVANIRSRSQYQGAQPDDFVSLGADACRIENATSYSFYNRGLKASENIWNWQGNTTMCMEEFTYEVFVPSTNESFVSNPLSHRVCKAPCAACDLQGPNYYIGVEANKASTLLSSNETTGTSLVFVECWVSTVPVNILSAYFGCDRTNERCYLLQDVVSDLKTELTGIKRVLALTYVGYVADLFLFWCVAMMFRINRREAEKHASKVAEGEEN